MMMSKGATSQACAACKYQRRKCTSECQFAPYFPADKPELFKNAHKLFGVKNILNILKTLRDPAQKAEAMTSIIYESNIREMFPVNGCCQVINLYYSQIRLVEEDLNAAKALLEFYRSQQQHEGPMPFQLELGMAPPNTTAIPLPDTPPQLHESYSDNIGIQGNHGNSPGSYIVSREGMPNSSFWIQSGHANMNMNNITCPTMFGPMSASQAPLAMQGIIHDSEDVYPFFDCINDDSVSKEACNSSSESPLKDLKQLEEYAVGNELMNAAACFSLTSIN